MAVALVAHYLGPRLGIGQYLNRLVPELVCALVSRGVSVQLWVSPNAYRETPSIKNLRDCRVREIPALDFSPLKRYAWVALHLGKLCAREDVQTVVWLSNPIVLPWHPATVAVIHDVNEWSMPEKYGGRLNTVLRSLIYIDSSLLFARLLVAISETTKQGIFTKWRGRRAAKKLMVIRNGTDSLVAGGATATTPAASAPLLLSVGRIDPAAKRLPEAVALVEALRRLTNDAWELHLVGGINESTRHAAEDFLASLSENKWVYHHGYVTDEELSKRYRQATAVVFLSDIEGFGLPIVEAASAGKWTIVSDKNQAAREVASHAIVAVDPDDSRSASIALLRALESGPVGVGDAHPWSEAAQAYAKVIVDLEFSL